MIRELSAMLTAVKHEQEYMQVRDRVHRSSSFPFLKFIKFQNSSQREHQQPCGDLGHFRGNPVGVHDGGPNLLPEALLRGAQSGLSGSKRKLTVTRKNQNMCFLLAFPSSFV